MTGPVERVPLTDEQLDEWENDANTSEAGDWPGANLAVDALVAELRASRARKQELRVHCAGLEASLAERIREREARQHRIDKALAWCHKANPRPDLNGDLFRGLVAALTGTGAADG